MSIITRKRKLSELPIKSDKKRADAKVKPAKGKSRAQRFLEKQGPKRPPKSDFSLEAEYPFDLPWSVI